MLKAKVRRTIRLTDFVSVLYKNCSESPKRIAPGSLYVAMVAWRRVKQLLKKSEKIKDLEKVC